MTEKALLRQACEWAASLRLVDIPADVRDLARAQLLSMDAAVHATLRHPVGDRLLGLATASASPASRGWAHDAASHALLTMALDFDETAFAGHLGHACAIPPLLAAAEVGADGATTMTAQVAAAEVAARITASVTLGSARGQTAAHTHAAAAVIGCGLVLGLSAEQLTVALSLALGQPRRVLPAAFMATDAKFWVAAGPILDASRCLAMARAGGLGIEGLIEARGGLLDQLAAVPLPGVFSGWGDRWHLRTLSIKAVPGCAYLTSAVEAAASLAPVRAEEVESVEVGASIFTLGMEAESATHMRGPQSPLPALGFSVGYNVAAALESGGLDVDDLHGERLASTSRWELAGRLRLVHDAELTVSALSATAPIGAALGRAGEAAREWLLSRGATAAMVDRVLAAAAGDEDFARPSKRLGTRLRVRLRDGRLLESERDAARGCCQEPVAERLALAEAKFRAQADPRIGTRADGDIELSGRYEEMTPAELRRWRGPRLHPAVSGTAG